MTYDNKFIGLDFWQLQNRLPHDEKEEAEWIVSIWGRYLDLFYMFSGIERFDDEKDEIASFLQDNGVDREIIDEPSMEDDSSHVLGIIKGRVLAKMEKEALQSTPNKTAKKSRKVKVRG